MNAKADTAPKPDKSRYTGLKRIILDFAHIIIIVLSVLLIFFISADTFKNINFLENRSYMTFQLWVCIIFITDFFIELIISEDKWRYVRRRWLFLLLSIPYLNIITNYNINLGAEALYFVRFIPLARGALAMSIVVGYLSSNAVTSFFISYLAIMIMIGYFCSLIFYQFEHGVNPPVDSYWTALWWTGMNLGTVGCNINPVTAAGKIVSVVLPVAGMIIFPLFTVYLTDFVRRNMHRRTS
ncbi:MAG: potassium channel family protein [Muribaculaceae bacterium]|nr:potassium channel family protein [Muribaculaceae bacterium]